MKPSEFEYAQPGSVAEAVALLSGSMGEGKVLAGGQSLVPLMNFRLAAPTLLVDLNRVTGLDGMEASDGTLRIGAMTRTRDLELDPMVRQTIPLLAAAASWVGHVQIRNRGTVGGSLAHADPAAELPAVCVLLDAELIAVSGRGARTIPASEFFVGFLTTTLAEDEILTEIRLPIPATGARWGFQEYAQRRGDFALAGAAVQFDVAAEEGAGGRPRIVVFGTSDRPLRATSAEDLLAADQSPAGIAAAAGRAAEETAVDDPRPDAAYRRRLTETLVRRAIEDALAGSPGSSSHVPSEVA
jgi:carbon-monoxide dehydrogenase medium subunit